MYKSSSKDKFLKSESINSLFDELTTIFKKNYCKDKAFQDELSAILIKETGNDNLGRLCREIINF